MKAGNQAGRLNYENVIFNRSAEKMTEIADRSVDLVVTSPPYFVGKEYEKEISLKRHWEILEKVFGECYRVLKDDGRICVNVLESKEIYKLLKRIGFFYRTEIIWYKGQSFNKKTAWGSFQSAKNPHVRGTHEYILVFDKKEKIKLSGSKINTISKEEFLKATRSVWYFPATKSHIHPAVFPLKLPLRLIELYSYKGDFVLDPFMGSGTTAKATKIAGRKYLGYEVNKKYLK